MTQLHEVDEEAFNRLLRVIERGDICPHSMHLEALAKHEYIKYELYRDQNHGTVRVVTILTDVGGYKGRTTARPEWTLSLEPADRDAPKQKQPSSLDLPDWIKG